MDRPFDSVHFRGHIISAIPGCWRWIGLLGGHVFRSSQSFAALGLVDRYGRESDCYGRVEDSGQVNSSHQWGRRRIFGRAVG